MHNFFLGEIMNDRFYGDFYGGPCSAVADWHASNDPLYYTLENVKWHKATSIWGGGIERGSDPREGITVYLGHMIGGSYSGIIVEWDQRGDKTNKRSWHIVKDQQEISRLVELYQQELIAVAKEEQARAAYNQGAIASFNQTKGGV